MKGFFSLLGITLIAAACGLIVMTFYSEPLEQWKNQERLQAYTEMRQNTVPALRGDIRQVVAFSSTQPITLFLDVSRSCPAP